MKKLPKQFSVYAKTIEEAVYICKKQKEICGDTFSKPEKKMFYRFSPNQTWDKWGYSSISYINHPGLPEYNIQHEFTFEEFKSYFEEEFVLPEMWCIKDCKEVSKWASEVFDCGLFVYDNYFHMDQSLYPKTGCYTFYDKMEGYTEITLEQFKKYVLKEVNKNVCFQSDGFKETGLKIILELEKLGGINESKYDGSSNGRYYFINSKGNLDMEWDIPKGYELVNLNKEKIMKNRILTPANATRIINIACSTWKPRLAEKWATNIVLNKDTEISEEFYKEMRKACTLEQDVVFDEIFGKDEQLISLNNLAIGEAMKICDDGSYDGIIISRIWSEDKPRYVNINNTNYTWSGYPDFKGKKVKLTITHEEIK